MGNWDIIDEQIQRSKIKRFDYKSLLGKTLTEVITDYKNKGLDSSKTTILINDTLAQKGITQTNIFRKVRISVCARYGEQNASMKRLLK